MNWKKKFFFCFFFCHPFFFSSSEFEKNSFENNSNLETLKTCEFFRNRRSGDESRRKSSEGVFKEGNSSVWDSLDVLQTSECLHLRFMSTLCQNKVFPKFFKKLHQFSWILESYFCSFVFILLWFLKAFKNIKYIRNHVR